MITDIMTIKKGISRVIWGYVFLYFDLNIGTVSIFACICRLSSVPFCDSLAAGRGTGIKTASDLLHHPGGMEGRKLDIQLVLSSFG